MKVQPKVIGYIQTNTWGSEIPYICYGLMSLEYTNFIIDYNYKQGYITHIKPVYNYGSVCKNFKHQLEQF